MDRYGSCGFFYDNYNTDGVTDRYTIYIFKAKPANLETHLLNKVKTGKTCLCFCNAPEAFSASPVVLASGCDSPEAMEESPVPSASPPTSSVSSVVQVRRYSWRSYAKNAICEKRLEFVGTNKQTNTNSSLFSPQKSLVSRVHLTKVVRKIGQQERSKGKTMNVHEFNALWFKGGKDMTSESHPNRKNNLGNNRVNSGDNKCYKSDITNSLASKGERGEERDEAHQLPGSN